MRSVLRLRVDERHKFVARIGKFSCERDSNGVVSPDRATILLRNIFLLNDNNEAEFVDEHMWVKKNRDLDYMNIKANDILVFDALVNFYVRHGTDDYGIRDVRWPRLATPQEMLDYQRWVKKVEQHLVGGKIVFNNKRQRRQQGLVGASY